MYTLSTLTPKVAAIFVFSIVALAKVPKLLFKKKNV